MDHESVRIMILILLFIVMPLLFLLFYSLSTRLSDRRSPWLRDYHILKMIKEKPDRFLSVSDLAQEAKISKRLSRRRLSKLSMYGVIRSYFTTMGKSSYTFKPADENITFPNTADEKLTFEKLLELFTQYNYQLTMAKIIAGTGSNIREVRKAMGEFKKTMLFISWRIIKVTE